MLEHLLRVTEMFTFWGHVLLLRIFTENKCKKLKQKVSFMFSYKSKRWEITYKEVVTLFVTTYGHIISKDFLSLHKILKE